MECQGGPWPSLFLAYLKSRQDWKKIVCFCFIYVQLLWAVVALQEWSNWNCGKCLKVSKQITSYFCFQFVYQVGPRPTLISTICKVKVFVSFMYSCCGQPEWRKRNWGKCVKVSSQIIRYFCFQFVYQVGPRPTLISTICKVNISFLSESELKLFDRSHRHVVFKQEEKVQTLKMK